MKIEHLLRYLFLLLAITNAVVFVLGLIIGSLWIAAFGLGLFALFTYVYDSTIPRK